MSATRKSEGNRIALLVQYDGSNFNGLQIQDSGRTVQGEIERALRVLFKKDIRITAAGRTDTGVHAVGQVIHFNFSAEISLQKTCISLNGILDKDVSVKNAYFVPEDFHARFSAVQREYLYVIYNHPLRSPFTAKRAMWVSRKIDMACLREASRLFLGERDFASFCKKTSADENTVRRIDEFEISGYREFIIIRILGSSFLHNMVRIMIGTMLDICKNNMDPGCIEAILEKKDRNAGGITAPAHGLYLNRVIYNPDLPEMESAF